MAPEVWASQPRATDGLALHYYRDPRVHWRALVVPDEKLASEKERANAAGLALARIRRGAHLVSLGSWQDAWRELRAFRGGERHPPVAAELVRHRLEFRDAG